MGELITSAIMCLALNIYNEARGEPIAGQYAVAQVTIQRTASPKWENTICGAVYEYKQFSWTLARFSINDEVALNTAIDIATHVINHNYKELQHCLLSLILLHHKLKDFSYILYYLSLLAQQLM